MCYNILTDDRYRLIYASFIPAVNESVRLIKHFKRRLCLSGHPTGATGKLGFEIIDNMKNGDENAWSYFRRYYRLDKGIA